jgi:hypothetical protein
LNATPTVPLPVSKCALPLQEPLCVRPPAVRCLRLDLRMHCAAQLHGQCTLWLVLLPVHCCITPTNAVLCEVVDGVVWCTLEWLYILLRGMCSGIHGMSVDSCPCGACSGIPELLLAYPGIHAVQSACNRDPQHACGCDMQECTPTTGGIHPFGCGW